jgi:peroxiredoxin (alkyl hydroperoxide reductase subunit C)
MAPEFSLPDFNGRPVSLSDYRGRKNVLLVFNRTFT